MFKTEILAKIEIPATMEILGQIAARIRNRRDLMNRIRLSLLVCSACLAGAVVAHAGPIVYTSSTNTGDLTAGITNYATFINGSLNQYCCPPVSGVPATLPYTPTSSILTGLNSPRVIGQDATPPVVVEFSGAVSQIRVFPSLDHVNNHTGNGNGSFSWDAYQWDIYGSNDGTNFTLLFDPIRAIGVDDPSGLTDPHYTLGTWTWTAAAGNAATGPTSINNWVSSVAGFGGLIGYEVDFNFGSNAYQWYAFRESTLATNSAGEREQEISGVAATVPEPTTWAAMLAGFGIVGMQLWRRQRGRCQA